MPLSEEQQQQVIEATRRRIDEAARHFGIRAGEIPVRFNLQGRSAGMYRVWQQRGLLRGKTEREIRYNPHIFARYFEDNLNSTVAHEVAHYISDLLYGLKNIRPHGREWKSIMQAFGVDACVTASYDINGLPRRRMQRFAYVCNCREHQLTAIRHNRIRQRGQRYLCRYCKQPLRPKAATADTVQKAYGSSP